MFDKISSGKIYGNTGNQFSAIEIDGDGVLIRNAADEMDSSGNLVPAGSDEVLSASRSTGTTINASYIKTGVIDANLLRAGLIQTVPSWNTKWYGAPEDHAAVQMGFTGGSIAATAVSTGSGTVSLTLPGGHGLVTGNYVRVSGLYFTTGTLLGGVGLNLPTNGPLDYASATVATNTLTYSKADITSGLTASTASTVYVGKAHTITAVVRSFDDPENPAELSTVVVTTGAAHGFSVGNYVELVNVAATIDGVAYITAVTSTTFTFKQRFGADISLDLAEVDSVLPDLGAPVAIKVLKSYTQNADGSIHITSGTVDSTLIVGEIAATEITIGSGGTIARVGSYPDATTPTFQGFWAGDSNPASAEFSVSTAGVLSATSATISGAITATTLTAVSSGSIGGWTIGATSLQSGSGATRVGLDNGGTNPSIYAGSSTPGSAPFRVTNAGAVTATSGAIGGWTLGSTSLISGSGATTVGLDSGGTNPSLYAGSSTPGSAPFRVTNAGVLTATSGTVGGWTLGSTTLTGTNVTLSNTGVVTAGTVNDVAIMSAADSTYRMWVGNATAASAPFRVTKAGAITSTSGAIGGWTLGSTSLTAGSAGTTVGVDSGGANPAFYAGSATPGSAPFRVTNAGALTATSGAVGGWTLGSTTLTGTNVTLSNTGVVTAGTGNNVAVMSAADATYRMWVGNATAASAPFRVEQDGSVTASDLTVTGGSITIGDFSLSTGGQLTDDLVLQQTRITNNVGVELLDTQSDGGNSYALGPSLNRAIETGIINGDFGSTPPTVGSAINNSTNRLPYFTAEVSHTDATAPYVQAVADATAASGYVLRFTIPSEAAVGRYARIVRYVAVPGSAARTWTNQPRAAWRNATGTTKTQAVVTVRAQYYQNDGTTTTGTQGTNVSKTFADVFASTYAYETQANPNVTGAIPQDGAYLKIEVGVQVSVLTTSTMTVDLTEVRYDRGLIQLLLADQVDPSAYGYGVIYLNNGTMFIRANETGPSGTNPTITLSATSGNINLDSTGTGIVTANGSEVALKSDLTGTTFDLTGDVTVTAGSFTLGAANSYVVSVDNDSHSHTSATIGVLALGTDTSGNYVASVTSANTLISVAGSGAEGAAITLTADTSPSLSAVTVSGASVFNGSVTLGDTTADSIRFLNMFQTTTITNSFNPRVYNASGTTPWRIFFDTSSERFKTNIVYMDDTDAILDVNPVSYHDKTDYETNGEESPRQYGFLAEDMAANPEGIAFVVHNGADAETIQYERLVVPLHSAMRALRARIEELEAKIAELETGA